MKNVLEAKNGKIVETSEIEVNPIERRAELFLRVATYNKNIDDLIVARDEAQALLDKLEILHDFSVKEEVADVIANPLG